MPTLREVRVRRLLSMRQLAKQAGLAPTTVYLVEAGRRLPQPGTIGKLAAVLGVAPEEVDEFRAAMDAALEGKDAA
ncbi:MAG: helix-turn-helix domain-containing protein [Chloroflexota bacterium]|nr:helix-turn-helix domain-containing protein [Chloroflexota bacterium]